MGIWPNPVNAMTMKVAMNIQRKTLLPSDNV